MMSLFLSAFLLSGAALPAHARGSPPPLKVLTFNVAGIPLAHPHWGKRLSAIIAGLKDSSYDLVALQEVWRNKDARRIIREAGYPYHARGGDGFIGNGLLLLSRFEVLQSDHETFTSFPRARHKVTQGEAIARKGILFARIAVPGGELDVYDTHLVADYPSDSYLTIRLAQGFELFEAVSRRSQGRPVLILGDFNTMPGDAEYRLITGLIGLRDACVSEGVERCEDSLRTGRVDHVMLLKGPVQADARLDFSGNIPGAKAVPYSDHRGIAATLGPALLRQKLIPGPGTLAALREVDLRVDLFINVLNEHATTRTWIPIYGFVHYLAYNRILEPLLAVHQRITTALILGGRAKSGTLLPPQSYEQ